MLKAVQMLLIVAAIAVLAYPIALAVDSAFGHDVVLLGSVNDPDLVEIERSLFALDESLEGDARRSAVIALYGLPGESASGPTRVVLADEGRLITPLEDPTLKLLPAASAGPQYAYPVQSQTVTLIGGYVSAVAGGVLVVLLLLARRLRRKPAA